LWDEEQEAFDFAMSERGKRTVCSPLVMDREKARRLRREGWSIRKIAAKIRVSPMTAQRIVNAAN